MPKEKDFMEGLNPEKLLLELDKINIWWSGKKLSERQNPPIKRKGYNYCKDSFEKSLDRDLVLIGPRRVGKSTILYQLVAYLIEEKKVDPKQILFIDLDDPLFRLSDDLKSILNLVLESKKLVFPIYLFLDEIQSAESWDKSLKFFYDHHRDQIKKVIATGSSAAELRKGSKESGIGRWEELDISTVSFSEFLQFNPSKKEETTINLLGESNKSVVNLKQFITYANINNYNNIASLFKHSSGYLTFLYYFICGGFPELIKLKDLVEVQRVIRRDILDRTLNRDMVQIYGVRQPKEVEKLFYQICYQSGSEFAISKLADTLSVKSDTIKRYIQQLDESRLIHIVSKWTKAMGKASKGHDKIYPIDASIRNALLGKSLESLIDNPNDFGVVAELMAVTHTKRWCNFHGYRLQYFRENKKEVDMVISEGEKIYPVEVKYKDKYSQGEYLKGFDALYKREQFQFALVIDRGSDIKGKINLEKPRDYEVYALPLWFYLMELSV